MGQILVDFPSSGPVVKGLISDTDDPWTTPNTDYTKFWFNSVTGAYGCFPEVHSLDISLSDLTRPPHPGPGGTWADNYFPTGVSSTSPFNIRVYKQTTPGPLHGIYPTLNPGWSGYSKLTDFDFVSRCWNVYPLGLTATTDAQKKAAIEGAEPWLGDWSFRRVTQSNADVWNPESFTFRNDLIVDGFTVNVNQDPANVVLVRLQLFISDMPKDDTPYLPTGTPTAGQVGMDFLAGKIARPGYDCLTDTADKMIIHPDRIPLKIAATGYLSNIASMGTSLVPATAFPISKSALVMYLMNEVGDIVETPPRPTYNFETALVTYRIRTVSGINRVEFKNETDGPVDIRYIIFAEDTEAPNAGAGDIMRAEPGLFQLIRPGTGSSPSARDVILDSRTVALPLIAHGYSTSLVASDKPTRGNRMVKIDFTNDGTWKPYVFATQTIRDRTTLALSRREFNMHYLSYASNLGADSFVCMIEDTSVRLFGFVGSTNATTRLANGTIIYSPHDFVGVHYYIYAVPLSL